MSIPTRILVLGMAHEDGTLLASELYPVAAACGQTPEQVRSCLRRLVSEGLFVRAGTGANASFSATTNGLAALGTTLERTRLAYAQDAAGRGWDRRWRLVAYAIPEGRHAARDTFRDRLLRLGGAPVQGGLYASPHPWHDDVRAEARRLGVDDEVTYVVTDDLEVGGEHDPRQLARRLWPIDEIGERYNKFVDEFREIPALMNELIERKERITDEQYLPGALAMAVAFQDCFNDDPLLPPELLPRPWPGHAARELALKSRRLAFVARKGPGRPALFHAFDEAIAKLP